MSYLTKNQRQSLLTDMLDQVERKQNEFPIIDEKGKFKTPILNKSGIVTAWYVHGEPPKGFKGLVLEVNDHGNVTVWNYFKNGNIREVASRV